MAYNHYDIARNMVYKDTLSNNFKALSGFDITPKNSFVYDGIIVNKLVIIKKSFIEIILKKKIKRKLELYLQFLLEIIETDGENGGSLNEVLSDITRYRDIVNYRYRKFLGDRYIDLLLKKITLLEQELKVKQYMIEEQKLNVEEDSIGSKSR